MAIKLEGGGKALKARPLVEDFFLPYQRGDTGRMERASGYTMKVSPGPDLITSPKHTLNNVSLN